MRRKPNTTVPRGPNHIHNSPATSSIRLSPNIISPSLPFPYLFHPSSPATFIRLFSTIAAYHTRRFEITESPETQNESSLKRQSKARLEGKPSGKIWREHIGQRTSKQAVKMHSLKTKERQLSERKKFRGVFDKRYTTDENTEGILGEEGSRIQMGTWIREGSETISYGGKPKETPRGSMKSWSWNSTPRDLELRNDCTSLSISARRQYSKIAHPPQPPEPPRTTNIATEGLNPAATTTQPNALPHLTPSGTAHMVSVSSKPDTLRTAVAVGRVLFSNSQPLSLIRSNSLKKGDVLSVARIAGIMAAKKCPDLIPLCHPIAISHVGVVLNLIDDSKDGYGGVEVQAKVACTGPTGVEMEAFTSVMGAALTVVDMCKAVDKGMHIQDVRVVLKEGGRSGTWREEGWVELEDGSP
jgi:molybdenum cofactor biosynthesis protein MoaC